MNHVILHADPAIPRQLQALSAAVAAYVAVLAGTDATATPVTHITPAAPPAPPPASTTASADAETSGEANTSILPTVDATGLPWDARIHADPASIIGSGHWRKKRNLKDEAFIATVEAELRARSAGTTPPPPPPAGTEGALDFDGFMAWVGAQMPTGKLNFGHISKACADLGLANVAAAKDQPNMVPLLKSALDAVIAAS